VRRAALGLALCAAAAARASANPVDVFGFGARGAALGGAASAVATDGSANYYNPAGLARGAALRMEVGYQVGRPQLTLDGKDAGVDATSGWTAAVAAPGTVFGVRVALGAALFLPDGWLSRTRTLPYAQPRFVYYDNRTQRLYAAANLAIALTDRLFLGGGVAFMARTSGTVALSGTLGIANPEQDSRLATSIAVDLVAVRYPQVGLAFEATRYLTLSASFRGSFLLRIDQSFSVSGDLGNPGRTPLVSGGSLAVRTLGSDLFQPWQLTAGAALRITRRLLCSLDLTFARWSDYETPASQVTVAADLGPVLGPLVHIPPPRTFAAPGFHDILSPRLGVEVRALERQRLALDLRGGWSFEPSPVPDQTGASNYVDSDKHTFALGAGLELRRLAAFLPETLALDAHAAVTALSPRSAHKLDPTSGGSDWTASGAVLAAGLTLRLGLR